jgi:hypothetical protein
MELLDSDTKFGFIIMDGSGTVRPFSRYTYTSCSYQSNFPSFPTTALRNPLWKHPSDPAQVLGRSPQEARFVLSLATAGFRHGLRLLTIQPALRFVRSRRSIRPSFLPSPYGGEAQLRPKGRRAFRPALHHRRQGQRPGYRPRRFGRLQVRAQPE